MHPYDFRRAYPEPYVPRHLTFEIRERIGADGEVVVAARRSSRRAACSRGSRALEVEAVAVALLWSIANGEHERRLGALLRRAAAGRAGDALARAQPGHARVPADLVRRDRRVAEAADAAATCASIESGLRERGLRGQLVAATSMGGVLPIEHLAAAADLRGQVRPVAGAGRGARCTPRRARRRATRSSATPAARAST